MWLRALAMKGSDRNYSSYLVARQGVPGVFFVCWQAGRLPCDGSMCPTYGAHYSFCLTSQPCRAGLSFPASTTLVKESSFSADAQSYC